VRRGAEVDRRIVGREARGPDARLGRDHRLQESFGTPLTELWLFGAGHVGRALVLALAPLPFRIVWVDSRDDAFPRLPLANLTCRVAARPQDELAGARPGSFVLIMTHDHAQDLDILHAALSRADMPHVGMIGSATKRSRFERRLAELGHPPGRARSFTCPIGVPGLASKEPAWIAAAVAAELLIVRSRLESGQSLPLLQAVPPDRL